MAEVVNLLMTKDRWNNWRWNLRLGIPLFVCVFVCVCCGVGGWPVWVCERRGEI